MDLAVWCTNTGQSPDTYMQLTRLQREAFERAAREQRGGK